MIHRPPDEDIARYIGDLEAKLGELMAPVPTNLRLLQTVNPWAMKVRGGTVETHVMAMPLDEDDEA